MTIDEAIDVHKHITDSVLRSAFVEFNSIHVIMMRVVRMQNRINWIESFDDAFCLCRIHPKTPTSTMHFVCVLTQFAAKVFPFYLCCVEIREASHVCVAGDCLNRPTSNTIICSTSFRLKSNNNISRQFEIAYVCINDDDIQLLCLFASSIDYFLSIVLFISRNSLFAIRTKLFDRPMFPKLRIHFRWFVRNTPIVVSNSCLISCTFAHKIIRCQTPFDADNFQFVSETAKTRKKNPNHLSFDLFMFVCWPKCSPKTICICCRRY